LEVSIISANSMLGGIWLKKSGQPVQRFGGIGKNGYS
jgi:hypothetical protein